LALVAREVPVAFVRREAARTPSPNSGWPMAAMALALGVQLRKPGVYALHAQGRAPGAGDAQRAVMFASKAVLCFAALSALLLAWAAMAWA
jgi:adenosylcobinamide-phosphate synthase